MHVGHLRTRAESGRKRRLTIAAEIAAIVSILVTYLIAAAEKNWWPF